MSSKQAKKATPKSAKKKSTQEVCVATPPTVSVRNSSTPSPMKVPDDVLRAVSKCRECRVVRHKVDNYPYSEVHFVVGSAGHKALIAWSERYVVDPLVTIIIVPARVPVAALAAAAAVSLEAQSIAVHCAPLSAAQIGAPGFAIAAGPIPMPPANVNVHHAKVALTFLLATLQNPPAALYPAITAIPVGSYVCTVQYAYRNSLQTVHVCR